MSQGSPPLKLAYYNSGHGLGHFTRSVEVARAFVARGHHVVAVSALNPELWTDYCEGRHLGLLQPGGRLLVRQQPSQGRRIIAANDGDCFMEKMRCGLTEVRQSLIDGGAVQSGPLLVDVEKTLSEYARVSRDVSVESEAAWLKAGGFHAVLTDATPIACSAAKLAGIPSVPVINFTWDLMYAAHAKQLGEATDGFYHRMVQEISRHYAAATLCIRLPGFSPMPAFENMVEGPLVVRKARKSREAMRQELDLPLNQKVILITFGGHGAHFQIESKSLPEGWVGLCVGKPGESFPDGFRGIELGKYHLPDLVNAVDCVLGKLGYGMISECLSHGVPLIYVPRSNWMEEPFFKTYVRMMECGLEMPFADFSTGRWAPFLDRASKMHVRYEGSTDATEVALIVERLVRAGGDPAKAGLDLGPGREARLIDRCYWHHMLSPGANTDFNNLDVPEFYLNQGPTRAVLEQRSRANGVGSGAPKERVQYSWQRYSILEGSDGELEDVREFLDHFGRLADSRWDDAVRAELSEEERAASDLFTFSQELIVARAPGRLDVMGGIADYSGSLVLQMPLREACLAAVQLSAPSSSSSGPHIRVVSYGASANHRGSSFFQLPISELLDASGAPRPYEQVRALFTPETHWASYVVGCLCVLMREERAAPPTKDVCLLISSKVPEGMGVSSSASVEVAAMQALVAALGYRVHGRRMGILCQMVENHVVGASCGIMDQMASCLGQDRSLLALLCQPADVKGQVRVPDHVGLWGISSGVRHCVGGADYGSVRAAAFMGLKMVQSTPSLGVRPSLAPAYLTHISPSEFAMRYAESLPAAIKGSEFTALFGGHLDPITQVDPDRTYRVRECASHPVFEHQRVCTFQQVLSSLNEEAVAQAASSSAKTTAAFEQHIEQQLTVLGELMLQSHASYSRCGLGSLHTDLLVELVMDEARTTGDLFGAKITGGGSGGTVCVLGRGGARGEAAVARVVKRYQNMTGGEEPYVFRNSGPGAAAFGTLRVLISE